MKNPHYLLQRTKIWNLILAPGANELSILDNTDCVSMILNYNSVL